MADATAPSLHDLVAVNLRYEAGAEALYTRALAQLVAKVLFAGGPGLLQRPRDMAHTAASILGIRKLSETAVLQALSFLKSHQLAAPTGDSWLLTDPGYKAIQTDVDAAEQRVQSILTRHFAGRLDFSSLHAWFTDACTEFYGAYGTEWAAALARRRSPTRMSPATLTAVLEKATKTHGLDAERAVLAQGFRAFLDSREAEDTAHQWSLSQAMLAARLVAANLGSDPIAVRDLRGSVVLLDTNVLLVTALEKHRLARELRELAEALNSIGVVLGTIEDTRREYESAVAWRRTSIIKAVSCFRLSILRTARDAFVQTALERGCTQGRDFERFFDEIGRAPASIDDVAPIADIDNDDTRRFAAGGTTDDKLKQQIQESYLAVRRRKKSNRVAEHDAALTAVVEGLGSKRQRYWVLTLDRGMHELAMRRSGPQELPSWLSFDALLQVLAVDNAGPAVNAADFAPLLAAIISHQCEPVVGTYTAEDLALLADVEERIADLSDEEVSSIATRVSRARLSPQPRPEAELRLEISRAFHKGKLDTAERLEATSENLAAAQSALRKSEERGDREYTLRSAAQTELVSARTEKLRAHAWWRAILTVLGWLVIAGLLGLAAWWTARRIMRGGQADGEVPVFVSLLGPALGAIGGCVKAIPRLRSDLATAAERARAQVWETLERMG